MVKQLYKHESYTLNIMVKHNLKAHEHIGLFLVFIGASWIGMGLYSTLLAANRLVAEMSLISGKELIMIPLFYGLGALVLVLGSIELREVLPGKNR